MSPDDRGDKERAALVLAVIEVWAPNVHTSHVDHHEGPRLLPSTSLIDERRPAAELRQELLGEDQYPEEDKRQSGELLRPLACRGA
jgi:hypothetical protein